MNFRRFFCCLLVCVVICFGLFSVSVYAREIDGYIVVTSWADNGSYSEFVNTIVTETHQDGDIYLKIDVTLPTEIEEDTVFNAKVRYTSSVTGSFSVDHMAMYDNSHSLISSSLDAYVQDDFIIVQDVQAMGNVKYLEFILKANSPFWTTEIENSTPPTTTELHRARIWPNMSNRTAWNTICFTPGMTWGEWVESDYNIFGYQLEGSGYLYKTNYIRNNSNGALVTEDTVILDGAWYYEGTSTQFTGTLDWNPVKLSGSWVFNSDVSGIDNASEDVYFACNGVSYNKLMIKRNTAGLMFISYAGDSSLVAWQSGDWKDDNYRYIDFGSVSQTVSQDFYDLLVANASVIESGGTGVTPVITYHYNFAITSVSIEEETEKGLLSGIVGWIKNVYNGIINIPKMFASAVSGFFDHIVNGLVELGNFIIDGIKSLFIPSEQDMIDNQSKWESLLSERFGAVYESTSIIDSWADAFSYSDTKDLIAFPSLTIDLVGTPFTFGGFEVDIVPDAFEGIIDNLKLLVNIACTFLFVNGMKKRLEGILK